MNNSFESKNSVMSSSNVVESSSSAKAASAHSNSASSAEVKPKATPREVRPLRERTSVKDTNDNTRYLKITEKNGDVVTAYLSKPSYQFAQDVDDDRSALVPYKGQTMMQVFTTSRYEKKLFKIFRNVEVNGKPTSGMNFDLANNGHVEAFNWMVRQANSFLRDKFIAD